MDPRYDLIQYDLVKSMLTLFSLFLNEEIMF